MTDPNMCGAQPDLPDSLKWNPCGLTKHSTAHSHASWQGDGVVIKWDRWTVDAVKILLGLKRSGE